MMDARLPRGHAQEGTVLYSTYSTYSMYIPHNTEAVLTPEPADQETHPEVGTWRLKRPADTASCPAVRCSGAFTVRSTVPSFPLPGAWFPMLTTAVFGTGFCCGRDRQICIAHLEQTLS